MKRPPREGEAMITHSTEQTGDVQSFSLCPENYSELAVQATLDMRHTPVFGYRLRPLDVKDPEDPRLEFYVLREDGTRLTFNTVRQDGASVLLHTDILHPMPDEEAMMMADLEQCAAIGMIKRSKP